MVIIKKKFDKLKKKYVKIIYDLVSIQLYDYEIKNIKKYIKSDNNYLIFEVIKYKFYNNL